MHKIKNFLVLPYNFLIFLYDLINYKIFKKKNSESSHQILIKLFCFTGGVSNSIISFFLSQKKINNNFFNIEKNSKLKNNFDITQIKTYLKKNGYYLKKNYLSERQLLEINNYILGLKGKYSSDEFSSNKYSADLDLKNPKAVRFMYSPNDLINCSAIQDLVTNREIIHIAQNYLNATPKLDYVESWWSFPSKKADSSAAQKWHFDMDRPKWLKVFFFLTNCLKDNGPHCYISSSHKNGGIPFKLRLKGYSRIEDKMVEDNFDKKNLVTFITEKKSILFEDTRGLHKGQKVDNGNRLILQFQYSDSLFGCKSNYITFPKKKTYSWLRLEKASKFFFENFYEN